MWNDMDRLSIHSIRISDFHDTHICPPHRINCRNMNRPLGGKDGWRWFSPVPTLRWSSCPYGMCELHWITTFVFIMSLSLCHYLPLLTICWFLCLPHRWIYTVNYSSLATIPRCGITNITSDPTWSNGASRCETLSKTIDSCLLYR